MLINKRFEAYKVKRAISLNGQTYAFHRPIRNEAGEPDGLSIEPVVSIKALYHEENQHIQVLCEGTTTNRQKKIPMLLCLWSDLHDEYGVSKLEIGDEVTINQKQFLVNGAVNIQEWNIISDISLEVQDNGIDISL